MSIKSKPASNFYKDLLQLDNSNNGITSSSKQIKDGDGNGSCLHISDDQLLVSPINDNTTSSLKVRKVDGTDVFVVDTTNEIVTASGNNVNTQYATFSIVNSESASFADDTHHAIPFSCANFGDSSNPPAFGTSTDPATTFTTAEGNATRASDLVPCMWYIHDNISIDAIKSIEGADTATGDTTRMHLMSFDFTSGSTSALSNGTVLANNSDVTNAGSEQAYLSSWTVSSSAVTAGKVVLAFFKSDSINSDYSLSIQIKYHLT
tara:strand:+ start:11226 stop:12014 length:789 start_codon:yes stop_codon:yes gene_type:complete